MKNTTALPSHYALKKSYDLKENKLNVIIQSIFMIIAGLCVGIAFLFKLNIFTNYSRWMTAGITIGLVILYMSIHELTHGLLISILSKTKSTYKIRFPFLTTGTNAYLNKRSFIIVCLGPAVIWGIIFIITLFVIPQNLFLSFYILCGLNFAGSAGDYIQVYLASKTSKEVLIKDDGHQTNMYDLN